MATEGSLTLAATYFRTALLLGLVHGDVVHRWAEQIVAERAEPAPEFIEILSVSATNLTALRHALWPLVIEPDPAVVLEAIFGLLSRDLTTGKRGIGDTLTVLRQMRSMLRLPPELYASLNAALVAYSEAAKRADVIKTWLAQFADCGPRWSAEGIHSS